MKELKGLAEKFSKHGRQVSSAVTIAPSIRVDGGRFSVPKSEEEKHRIHVYEEIIETE